MIATASASGCTAPPVRIAARRIICALAVFLGLALGGWPGGACAQSDDDDRGTAAGNPAAGSGASRTPSAAIEAKSAAGKQRQLDDPADDEEDATETRDPSTAPGRAKSPASSIPSARRSDTAAGAAARGRDADDGDDNGEAVTRKPAAASGPAEKPASAAPRGRKVDTRAAPARDEDEDGNETAARQPADKPHSTTPADASAQRREQAGTKRADDRGDDETMAQPSPDEEDAGAELSSASGDSLAGNAKGDPCSDNTGAQAERFISNPDVRNLIAGTAGAVPTIGSLLGGVIRVLWKDNSQEALFDQMKNYVDRLIPDMIAREHVDNLRKQVDGLRGALTRYDVAKDPVEKGGLLSAILITMDAMQPDFFDPRLPAQTLAAFVAFGTLRLTALRENYVFGADYYGNDDPNRFTELKNTEKLFTEGAEQIRQRAMAWRLDKIRIGEQSHVFGGRAPGGYTARYVRDELCGWQSGEFRRDWQLPDRRGVVQAGFGRDLDAILAPTRQWVRLAEPTAPRLASRDDRRRPTEHPAPAAESIVPCSESEDAAVRDVTTEAGTKCRREAIDKYLAALDIVKGRYNAATLRTCLNDLRSELASGNHEGCGSQLVAGACYYRKLRKCREEARLDGDALALSAVNADDPENSDDTASARHADCDGRCAADQIRRFMLSNPEPAGTKPAIPKRAGTKTTPEPDGTEDN
jgi:hypothetical protein